MARLLPVVAPLERALRVDQHVGDILDVADFPFAAPHLEEGIVGGARRIGRIEHEHSAELGPPAGRQGPVLSLDVVDDRRSRPGQERGDHKADALAAARRREAEHMLGTVVAKVSAAPAAQHHAFGVKQAGVTDLSGFRPASGAIGGDRLGFARPPDRHRDGDDDGGDRARRCDIGPFDEDFGSIGVVSEPPPEEGRRRIERPAEQRKPRPSEFRLKGKPPSRPLGRRPNEGEDDGADKQHLAPENLGPFHDDKRPGKARGGLATLSSERA